MKPKKIIFHEGIYTIRNSEVKDASSYVAKFDIPMGLILRDTIIRQRRNIQNFQNSAKDYCFTILEGEDVIGLIEITSKIGTHKQEGFAKILLAGEANKKKEEVIEEIFISFLKKAKLFYVVYIYKESRKKRYTRKVEIA